MESLALGLWPARAAASRARWGLSHSRATGASTELCGLLVRRPRWSSLPHPSGPKSLSALPCPCTRLRPCLVTQGPPGPSGPKGVSGYPGEKGERVSTELAPGWRDLGRLGGPGSDTPRADSIPLLPPTQGLPGEPGPQGSMGQRVSDAAHPTAPPPGSPRHSPCIPCGQSPDPPCLVQGVLHLLSPSLPRVLAATWGRATSVSQDLYLCPFSSVSLSLTPALLRSSVSLTVIVGKCNWCVSSFSLVRFCSLCFLSFVVRCIHVQDCIVFLGLLPLRSDYLPLW